MKKNIFFFVFSLNLFLYLNSISCNTTEPPPPVVPKPILTLEQDEITCTEVWLKLTTKDLTLPAGLTLKQYNPTGDSLSQILTLNTHDSVLYIDSLLPNQSYKFKVIGNTTNNLQTTTNLLSVTTLDTTSHNFTWQTFEFGEHSSSLLYDVAIIDENNIWAVGEIYMNDSLGNPDPIAYNAIYWNGTEWKPKKINVLFRGSTITPPLYGVFAFSPTDIWFSAGVPIHGDGTNWIQYHLFDMGILGQDDGSLSRIWGISSNDIYLVGNKGTIAHATATQFGYNFTKLESGTTSNINDIWGEVDELTGERKILCAATDRMLSINSNNQVDSLSYFSNRSVNSIWFKGKYKFFSSGDGVFINTDNRWQEQNQLPFFYTYTIRGSAVNNVFVGGAFGLTAQYNGVSWQRYTELTFSSGRYIGISVKSNKVCFVGRKGAQAIITLGSHH